MILKNLKKTLEIEENFLNLIISFYEKKNQQIILNGERLYA